MGHSLEKIVLRATGATALAAVEPLQSLWSGYGQIVRCHLEGAPDQLRSVVVKHVRWPTTGSHPRGWNTDHSHARKVRSYEVETAWYGRYAQHCNGDCRVPACLALETLGDEVFMVLEDLDASGFHLRRESARDEDLAAGLTWLAHFHATFMQQSPMGLWETGTYWHLATRPDELVQLDDVALKAAAPELDQALAASPYQTFVHGDAKLANFCFGIDGGIAAVDFQYVGGGCGIKDVAYFIGSCLSEDECESEDAALLDTYFDTLREAVAQRDGTLDVARLEESWRSLYPVAWTDFYRFLRGWSPGHWKIHRYSERLAREVLARYS